MAKVALIKSSINNIDITGQDGAYLTELLLNKGYVIHSIELRTLSFDTQELKKIGAL